MAYFLLKTEPSEYSFADLQRDKTTVWSGVSNATALKHIRSMRKGDELLIYHTGNEKAVVGTAVVVKAPYPDPNADSDKLVVIDIKVGKALKTPVTLAQVKAEKAFAGWELLRIGRLSVVPTTASHWKRVIQLSNE